MVVWAELPRRSDVGADLSLLGLFSGHTTTQPSSIEEEGFSVS